jgi:hypothetical protein
MGQLAVAVWILVAAAGVTAASVAAAAFAKHRHGERPTDTDQGALRRRALKVTARTLAGSAIALWGWDRSGAWAQTTSSTTSTAPTTSSSTSTTTSTTTTVPNSQYVLTTDPRLTDQRVPLDGSVTNAKVADKAAIAATKLALPQLNLRSFGAKGDGTTDDSAAIQAALEALAAQGGGELLVPPGKYVLRTGAATDFNSRAPAVRVVGYGSASQLLIQVPATQVALIFYNTEHLVIQGLTFVGTPGVRNDAWKVLSLVACLEVIVRDCSFYGLSSIDTTGGCIVEGRGSQIHMQSCAFRGSAGSYSEGTISNTGWSAFTIEDTQFVDYGTLQGVFHSKIPVAPNLAWITLNDPIRPPENSYSQNVVQIRDCLFDEGAFKQVLVAPTTTRVSRVHIDGMDSNVNGTALGAGVVINKTDEVVIERSFFGYASVGPQDAVLLSDVRNTRLERIFCLQQSNRITADAKCRSLTLVECVYGTINSGAAVTNIIRDGRGGLVAKMKDGPIVDTDFDAPPPDGTIALDRTNSKLYVRVGGSWKAATLS